jgi:hypothetical protein
MKTNCPSAYRSRQHPDNRMRDRYFSSLSVIAVRSLIPCSSFLLNSRGSLQLLEFGYVLVAPASGSLPSASLVIPNRTTICRTSPSCDYPVFNPPGVVRINGAYCVLHFFRNQGCLVRVHEFPCINICRHLVAPPPAVVPYRRKPVVEREQAEATSNSSSQYLQDPSFSERI